MTARYAIYFAAAPGSLLESFGTQWLGRNHRTGEALEPRNLAGLTPARWRDITTDPRHYGFHATLKPPFALAEGSTREGLLRDVAAFAETRPSFTAPPLRPRSERGFLALVLSAPSPQMQALSDDLVRAFDHYRAPASPEELAKRRKAGLTPELDANLVRWGYPYVMSGFKFHMTLTQRLPEPESSALLAALQLLVAPLCTDPLPVDAIAVYEQTARDAPFMMIERFALAG